MKMHLVAGLPILALLSAGAPAGASPEASGSYQLRLSVPVLCTLKHEPGSAVPVGGGGYALGDLQEYCNAPGGYQVMVNYTPGSMRGALISVGEERVILDGSGQTIVSNVPGPRIRDRQIVAVPGPTGFDTDRLDFTIAAH